MERKKPGRKSNSGLKKESGRWRPTTRQVFWAIGIVLTLMTIALLVVRLYPGLWENVSREPVALLKGRVATLIAIGVALAVLMVLLAKGSASLEWTGFRGKTLWDLLQLLIVPLALAVIGLWFTAQQDARQQQLENQRAKAERELATQRAQDEALQAYLDQMGSLLLEKDLRDSKEDSEVRTLARARTATVLRRLDPSHKTAVLQFLQEAELIQRVKGGEPLISLSGADLSGANLGFFTNLSVVSPNLKGADLSGANLSGADLRGANLHTADLSVAYLRNANLAFADLSEADLSHANLSFAYLKRVNLSFANLNGAYLRGARLHTADLAGANLSEADLRRADLSDALLGLADLRGADLGSADLSNANLSSIDNLSEADLSEADLSGADLSYVEGIRRTELEQQAESLEGATMPDRTIIAGRYVTWPTVGAGFKPALSFSVSDGWRLYDREMPDVLIIVGPEEGSSLAFTSPLHVFDPSTLSEPKEVAAPENADEWVSWFQSHPNLDTSDPVPMSVGGASAKRIDVTTSSTPENYPQEQCTQPCVLLYPTSESEIGSFEGSKDRFVIVDVGGKTVLIDVFAPADKFDEFLPKAQKVLDSVEWKGG